MEQNTLTLFVQFSGHVLTRNLPVLNFEAPPTVPWARGAGALMTAAGQKRPSICRARRADSDPDSDDETALQVHHMYGVGSVKFGNKISNEFVRSIIQSSSSEELQALEDFRLRLAITAAE